MKNLIVLALVAALAWFGYGKLKAMSAPQSPIGTELSPTSAAQSLAQGAPATAASQFTCDGRTHCSQMTSCAEATYFLQHCPNTQMDGNNDGEPCEKQWCK